LFERFNFSVHSCNVSSTPQHESSRTRASSTGDLLISGEVSYVHWLDVVARVRFRVCIQVFKCLHKMAPEYLSTYCQPVSGVSGRRHLRSADRGHLDFPRVKLASVRRTFICIRRPFELELTSCLHALFSCRFTVPVRVFGADF